MTEAIQTYHSPVNTKRMIFSFISTYKFVLTMMGGLMLTVPIWQDVPTLMGWVGLVVAAIGAVAQVVKIFHDLAEGRRKEAQEKRVQEEHDAKMGLYRTHLEAGRLKEAEEVLGV
jgi:hypothetical protein